MFKKICVNVEELINHISKKIGLNCEIKIKFSHLERNNSHISYIDLYKIKGNNIILANGASTSEKFCINILFKIAILNILNISIPSFLIIDELFECLDNDKLNIMDKFLDVLHIVYDNLYIITHLSEISEYCTKTINIVKNDFDSLLI